MKVNSSEGNDGDRPYLGLRQVDRSTLLQLLKSTWTVSNIPLDFDISNFKLRRYFMISFLSSKVYLNPIIMVWIADNQSASHLNRD